MGVLGRARLGGERVVVISARRALGDMLFGNGAQLSRMLI
jgi:hypothetical protein